MNQNKKTKKLLITLHVLVWLVILCFPIILMGSSEAFNYHRFFMHLMFTSLFMILFYVNYVVLIPKYFLKKKITTFVLVNIALVLIFMTLMNLIPQYFFVFDNKPPRPPHGESPWMRNLFMISRDFLILVMVIVISIAIKMIENWSGMEKAKSEAEKNQYEAELLNLRNQINPHFLLNTLNNIYALIAFDAEKAQQAVQDLSKLLRHILYDNKEKFVSIHKEIDFIKQYIELMKIRLSDNIKVETHFNIPENSTAKIAPLIFISLIENAFKHGVSANHPGYIYINIYEEKNKIICNVKNSYFPKSIESDKSGSGIGLNSINQRLNLLYPEKYQWNMGISDDGKDYYSELIIEIL
ncbi:sensor histidine kinase [Odoribacter sp. OttesenSCG-928-L07]|nr:sensor histidine kinase [Odoribacter sp. OttesenSCG-928-L07]MDL2239319.1 sensor histidine kinase [Bacteroidales bacterium OttesenSCG-928-L14]MDL2240364.1 sensor histidine kinase [Bacteroidales bacterium OttesenSCG-928-K22]